MMRIDEKRIHEVIDARKPRSVALNGPEGLIPKIQTSAINITEKFGIPAYVIGDTCWGSCDLNTQAADMLDVEILFNIGHTIAYETFGERVIMINAYDDISFESVARKCASSIQNENFKALSLLTDSQHLNQIGNVKKIFEEYGYKVIIGKGKGQLNDGQVFGCEFYPAFDIQNLVDAYIFLGQSRFHSVSIAMSTEKPTYMLDPYFEEYTQINKIAQTLKKKAILSIYKAMEARRIGIIIGLKEGQFAKIQALKLKKLFEQLGKCVQLIAMTNITNDHIRIFKGLDAFVEVACPRIAIDDHFDKPMLSTPQAFTLIKLLKNEPIDELLKIHHWL
ncbi:MAG TPA: diphthamide biosynthesis enzyme Dph2 [Candidatus Nitrosopolaris sp.]|nr:diphthamide biosynthesis enzyme Dph2 [Candidatus Nitrosopolaris sp.]